MKLDDLNQKISAQCGTAIVRLTILLRQMEANEAKANQNGFEDYESLAEMEAFNRMLIGKGDQREKF